MEQNDRRTFLKMLVCCIAGLSVLPIVHRFTSFRKRPSVDSARKGRYYKKLAG